MLSFLPSHSSSHLPLFGRRRPTSHLSDEGGHVPVTNTSTSNSSSTTTTSADGVRDSEREEERVDDDNAPLSGDDEDNYASSLAAGGSRAMSRNRAGGDQGNEVPAMAATSSAGAAADSSTAIPTSNGFSHHHGHGNDVSAGYGHLPLSHQQHGDPSQQSYDATGQAFALDPSVAQRRPQQYHQGYPTSLPYDPVPSPQLSQLAHQQQQQQQPQQQYPMQYAQPQFTPSGYVSTPEGVMLGPDGMPSGSHIMFGPSSSTQPSYGPQWGQSAPVAGGLGGSSTAGDASQQAFFPAQAQQQQHHDGSVAFERPSAAGHRASISGPVMAPPQNQQQQQHTLQHHQQQQHDATSTLSMSGPSFADPVAAWANSSGLSRPHTADGQHEPTFLSHRSNLQDVGTSFHPHPLPHPGYRDRAYTGPSYPGAQHTGYPSSHGYQGFAPAPWVPAGNTSAEYSSGGSLTPSGSVSGSGYISQGLADESGVTASTSGEGSGGGGRARASSAAGSATAADGERKKRPRRRHEEIDRMYHCGFEGCDKSYGTLNHLNAHVALQKHGPKRTPQEFREMRRAWRAKKKEDHRRRQGEEAAQAAHASMLARGEDPMSIGKPASSSSTSARGAAGAPPPFSTRPSQVGMPPTGRGGASSSQSYSAYDGGDRRY